MYKIKIKLIVHFNDAFFFFVNSPKAKQKCHNEQIYQKYISVKRTEGSGGSLACVFSLHPCSVLVNPPFRHLTPRPPLSSTKTTHYSFSLSFLPVVYFILPTISLSSRTPTCY